MLGEIKHN